MSESGVLAALRPVIEMFERLRVGYLLGGSLASSAHGMARATMDIDLGTDLRTEHVAPLVAALSSSYYVSVPQIEAALANRSSFNLIHLASMVKIDVFVGPDRPYDREALRRRRRDKLVDGDASLELWISSPEDVILRKLEWYRLGGEVSDNQWSDVLGVLRVQGRTLDATYLRQWAAQIGVADLLERALIEAGVP